MSCFKFKSLVLFIKIVTKLLLLRPNVYMKESFICLSCAVKLGVVVALGS